MRLGAVDGGSNMRGLPGRTTGTIVLLATLMLLPGQQSQHLLPRPAVLSDSPAAPATVTSPAPGGPVSDAPVSVAPATGSYAGGVPHASAPVAKTAGKSLPSSVLAAYTLAIAVAPPGCHLSLSLLAAIGQVESGNLAGHALDATNRVTPAIFGPVLNGKGLRAVADTDGGQWDGNKRWDRALGPFQFIPSSWRLAGVDMDADGIRDPQNIFDAAGAAMVYLCAGGRDLATPAGLRQGVLAYNHSISYLKLVLAWKAVLDNVDLSGLGEPTVYGAWSLPMTLTAPADVSWGGSTPRPDDRHTVKHGSAAPGAGPTQTTPSPTPSEKTTGPTKQSDSPTPAVPTPSVPTDTPSPGTPSPGTPSPGAPSPGTESPGAEPSGPPVTPVEPPTPVCDDTVVPTDPDDPCALPGDSTDVGGQPPALSVEP